MADLFAITTGAAGIGVLATGFVLGLRHGIDWDHIAAITDITSTTAAAGAAEAAHGEQHDFFDDHHHGHGGELELRAHDAGPGAASIAPAMRGAAVPRLGHEQRAAIVLGTLYALGHAAVVVALGLAALAFGALLPDWLDPIMGRIVGVTLIVLGVWVLYSVYRYATGRRCLPPPQPMDARVRRHPLRVATSPGQAPRPRTRRTPRDELLRHEDRVRRGDDPRRRRRDGDPGAADRRGRRRRECRSRRADALRVRPGPVDLELRDRPDQFGRVRGQPDARAHLRRGRGGRRGVQPGDRRGVPAVARHASCPTSRRSSPSSQPSSVNDPTSDRRIASSSTSLPVVDSMESVRPRSPFTSSTLR